jgi:hypothetical protein
MKQHSLILFLLLVTFATSNAKPVKLYGVEIDVDMNASLVSIGNEQQIFYTSFADTLRLGIRAMQPLAATLKTKTQSLHFSDWLTLRFIAETASTTWKKQSEKTFAAACLLRAMGKNVSIAVIDKKWQLAVEVNTKVLFSSMMQTGGRTYVVFDMNTMKLIGKAGEAEHFFDAEKFLKDHLEPIDLLPDNLPDLPVKKTSRTVSWKSGTEKLSLTFSVNDNLVKYLAERPQLDVEYYFNEPVSEETRDDLIDPLRQMVDARKLTGRAAVQFLLDFCTNAFEYKDDKYTPQGEHVCSVEETLLSRYSDCEDRSLLLSALLRGVLGLEVIGVEYPNHISLAVHLPVKEAKREGEEKIYVVRDAKDKASEKEYISTDASIFGGTLGDVNPQFTKQQPDRIFTVGTLVVQ